MIRNDWLNENKIWIRSMVERGYSRTKIYDVSREQGWGIRKTDALETLRYYLGIKQKARDVWKSTPKRYKPSDLRMPRHTGLMAKKYLIRTEVTRRDTVTGEISKRGFQVGFNEMKTRGELEDKIRDIGRRAGVNYDKPMPEVIGIDMVEVWKNKYA